MQPQSENTTRRSALRSGHKNKKALSSQLEGLCFCFHAAAKLLRVVLICGEDRIRTDDLLTASQAL